MVSLQPSVLAGRHHEAFIRIETVGESAPLKGAVEAMHARQRATVPVVWRADVPWVC